MQRLLVIGVAIVVGAYLLFGWMSRRDRVPTSSVNDEHATKWQIETEQVERNDVVVFRAEYYRTTGPCIQIGDVLAMPNVDGFRILEVIQGDLMFKTIEIRPFSEGGPRYPKKLIEGNEVVLRFTPSVQTQLEIRKYLREGVSHVWVDGHEIEDYNFPGN